MEGRPVKIVVVRDDGKLELNEEDLKSILCEDRVKEKPIAVISVAGAFRKGKSFFLNFCLRFLNACVSQLACDVYYLINNTR